MIKNLPVAEMEHMLDSSASKHFYNRGDELDQPNLFVQPLPGHIRFLAFGPLVEPLEIDYMDLRGKLYFVKKNSIKYKT
jgi:hypothetical protein